MNSNLDMQSKLLTVKVAGDLISTNAESLRGELGRLLEVADGRPRQWTAFRLDLTAAKMVDSVGLNLIVSLLKQAQKQGAKMQVAYSSQNILRTFTFTRLDKQIEMVKV